MFVAVGGEGYLSMAVTGVERGKREEEEGRGKGEGGRMPCVGKWDICAR